MIFQSRRVYGINTGSIPYSKHAHFKRRCLEGEASMSLEHVEYVSRFCSHGKDLLGVDLGEKLRKK